MLSDKLESIFWIIGFFILFGLIFITKVIFSNKCVNNITPSTKEVCSITNINTKQIRICQTTVVLIWIAILLQIAKSITNLSSKNTNT